MLLRKDVLRTHVFWREGWAELKFSDKPAPQSDPPPEIPWQVGFVFLDLNSGGCGNRGFAESLQGMEKKMSVPGISAEDLKQRLDAGENLFLLDVRDEFEFETSNIGGHLIPLAELPRRVNELDVNQKIVAVCKMGPRGAKAVQFLNKAGFSQVWNLTGGIHAWSDRVDHGVRKY